MNYPAAQWAAFRGEGQPSMPQALAYPPAHLFGILGPYGPSAPIGLAYPASHLFGMFGPFGTPQAIRLAYPASHLFGMFGGSSSTAIVPRNPFEVDLLSYLGAAGLVAYPGHIPQGVSPPAITFLCVSEGAKYSLRSAAGLTARNYQFGAFSTDYLETIAMERSLRAVLHGFRGMMGTTLVSSCRLQDMLDLPAEANVDASDEWTYHRSSEYRILLKEAVPLF